MICSNLKQPHFIAQSSHREYSSQFSHRSSIQAHSNLCDGKSSIYGNYHSNADDRYDSAHCVSEYNQHNIPQSDSAQHLSPIIYRKTSFSSNIPNNVQHPAKSNRTAPPPLAKKPSLSQYASSMSNVKSLPLTSSPHPTGSPRQDGRYTHGRDPVFQTGSSGYEQQSSSYFSATLKTPITTSTPPTSAVIESRAVSPSSSPFSDKNQILTKKKRAPPPPPPSRGTKKKVLVEAIYDYNATQEGDLSFSLGDHIEIIEKSNNTDDWWKGRIGSQIGMFPGKKKKKIWYHKKILTRDFSF